MKTKNVIGHMMLKKESASGRFRRWAILPRLVCLLLAILIWLIIVNVGHVDVHESSFRKSPETTQETE